MLVNGDSYHKYENTKKTFLYNARIYMNRILAKQTNETDHFSDATDKVKIAVIEWQMSTDF